VPRVVVHASERERWFRKKTHPGRVEAYSRKGSVDTGFVYLTCCGCFQLAYARLYLVKSSWVVLLTVFTLRIVCCATVLPLAGTSVVVIVRVLGV